MNLKNIEKQLKRANKVGWGNRGRVQQLEHLVSIEKDLLRASEIHADKASLEKKITQATKELIFTNRMK